MYVRHLHVQNVKLLRDVKVDFVRADGKPRMWTVFVGENRLCKTTLLQTIAAAACGTDRGTQLVTDVIASWPDLRNPVPLSIEAKFGVSKRPNDAGVYLVKGANAGPLAVLTSTLSLEPDRRVFGGSSAYDDSTGTGDPLNEARSKALPGWFVAGYGPSRLLPGTGSSPRQSEPTLDRLRPLFGQGLIGTGFIELLGGDLAQSFVQILQSVFVAGGLLPHVTAIELRGRGDIRSAKDLVEAQQFEMDPLDARGKRIRVPVTWLSQGYQSTVAWLADVVGQVLIDAGAHVDAADMEGTVLLDEIDLHLHPTWQAPLIPALKKVFPRLQFIATTHSPMMLPGLEAEELYILSQDADGSVRAAHSPQSPALLTGSELLQSFFEIQQLYPNPLGQKLRDYGYMASDPMRSDDEDQKMLSLRAELKRAGIEFDWEPVAREVVE